MVVIGLLLSGEVCVQGVGAKAMGDYLQLHFIAKAVEGDDEGAVSDFEDDEGVEGLFLDKVGEEEADAADGVVLGVGEDELGEGVGVVDEDGVDEGVGVLGEVGAAVDEVLEGAEEEGE